MSRLNSFDVAGRVDNTSMLVGTEVYKKVATVKNYKINAVRRFMLEGLAPETGGLLKYHEISYEGDQYSTPAEFVNSLNPDVEVLRYHVLVVAINEDKHLFTRQGVTIGNNSETVEDEDFIALSGITATTIRNLVLDLESRVNASIAELADEVDTKLSMETTSTNANVSVLTSALSDETSARSSLGIALNAKIDNESTTRTAAVNSVYTALANETEARAELETQLVASIENEKTLREAAITSVQTALVTEAESRAELETELSAAITTEATNRQAAVNTLQQADVTEAQTRAALGTTLNAAITTEASTRAAAITSLNTAVANETSARTSAVTSLTAAINTEKTDRQAAVTTLQQADVTEAQTRATLGTTLTAAIGTETTNRQAAVNTLNTAIANESTARATLGTTLTAAINTETANRSAAITTLNTAITNEASTRASAITSLGTTVTNNYNTLSSNITSETNARTTAIQSVANSVNSLTATVNGHTSSITTTQNAIAGIDGKLSASYGLSVDANGRIASMKLLSNGTSSSVAFTADSFKVFNGTSNVSPFVVENGQVKMTGVTTADTLITPGTGPSYPSATWNGLSINNGNDNALRFRHANGQVGIEIGVIGGQLTLNWFDANGNLVWKGGSNGITYIDNIPASSTPYEIGLISSTVPEFPSALQLEDLKFSADSLIIFYDNGMATVGGSGYGIFPSNKVTKYLYWQGQNAQSAANAIYEGMHDDINPSSPFITNGWYSYYMSGITLSDPDANGNNILLSLMYFKNGKITNNAFIGLYRSGAN